MISVGATLLYGEDDIGAHDEGSQQLGWATMEPQERLQQGIVRSIAHAILPIENGFAAMDEKMDEEIGQGLESHVQVLPMYEERGPIIRGPSHSFEPQDGFMVDPTGLVNPLMILGDGDTHNADAIIRCPTEHLPESKTDITMPTGPIPQFRFSAEPAFPESKTEHSNAPMRHDNTVLTGPTHAIEQQSVCHDGTILHQSTLPPTRQSTPLIDSSASATEQCPNHELWEAYSDTNEAHRSEREEHEEPEEAPTQMQDFSSKSIIFV